MPFDSILGKIAVEDEDEELARAVAASLEESKEVIEASDASDDMAEAEPEVENEPSLNIKPDYPPLPEEPTGSRELLCRVAIRLPNNRRIQRNFLHTDPIKVTLTPPIFSGLISLLPLITGALPAAALVVILRSSG